MNLSIASSIIDASDCLKKALKSNNGDLIENTIHALIMAILNRSSKHGEKFICPLKRFIIYASVLPSGKIEDPAGINATLTELKWPIRATAFWENFLQNKNDNSDPER